MNTAKRIAFYDDSYAFGGHEIMLCRLLHLIKGSTAFATLALFSHENRRYLEEQGFIEGSQDGLTMRFLSYSNPRRMGNLAALFSFRKILEALRRLRAFRPDVVVVAQGGIDTCMIGILASRLCGFRTLSYIPNLNGYFRTHPNAKNRVRDRLNRPFYRLPHEFVVIRGGQTEELRALGFKGTVHVVYNGMDFSRLLKLDRGMARKALGLAEDAYWIGMVGRIDLANKGQDLLLKSMVEHPREFAGARLLFVGDGHDQKQLELLMDGLGCRARCVLLPFRKELSSVYSSLDLLAIPSKSEGMPLVMAEAMLIGIPVTAAAIDGMREMLPAEWLFPSGNAAALAERVGEIRSRPQEERVETNRTKAEACFAESRFLAAFLQILK